MSPKGGTLPIRVSLHGLRIRVQSGTHNVTVRDRIVARLREVAQYDHLVPIIRDVALGITTPMELMELTRGKDLEKWRARRAVPLERAIRKYLVGLDRSAKHKQEAGYALLALARTGGPRQTPEDVPRLLGAERERRKASGQAPAFNHLRNYVRAFLKHELGRDSDAYRRVADMSPLSVTRKRQGHPCTVQEAVGIASALGEHFGPVWLAMCLSGAMPDEVWGGKIGLDSESGHLRIRGTKRASRNRLVPLVGSGLLTEKPLFSYWQMCDRMKRATGGKIQPYDARRTAAKWLALAGVPLPHQWAYLGHGPHTMTGLYQAGNERPYLDRDAGLLMAFLEAEVKKSAGVLPLSLLPLLGSNQDSPDPESVPTDTTSVDRALLAPECDGRAP